MGTVRLVKGAECLWLLRFLLDESLSFLLGDLTMDLAYVIFAGDGEVSRLHDSAIDVLSPVLSHLLLVNDSQELGHELWIDSEELDEFVPDAVDLIGYDFDIVSDQFSYLFWVALAG